MEWMSGELVCKFMITRWAELWAHVHVASLTLICIILSTPSFTYIQLGGRKLCTLHKRVWACSVLDSERFGAAIIFLADLLLWLWSVRPATAMILQYEGDSIHDPCCIFCREGRTYFRRRTVCTVYSPIAIDLLHIRARLNLNYAS